LTALIDMIEQKTKQ